MRHHDAIIIGGGHNGLVTAAYLARAGKRVLVLERRHLVGGACVTETDVFDGFRVSTAAYVNSLFRKEIIRDLDLPKHGFRMLERNPSSFTPLPDGRHLFLGPDARQNLEEIGKFSTKDAEAYPKYEAMLERVALALEPLLTTRPPNLLRPSLGDLWRAWKIAAPFQKLGTDGMAEAVEMLTGPARVILDRWFESEVLKGTLATDAVIGAMAAPSMPGTAYVLFHHVMGETNGKRGVWGYVQGGMGSLSEAIASSAKAHGAEIRVNARVKAIIVKKGRVAGVALEDGTEHLAPIVASNADPHVTFEKLMAPSDLPADFLEAIRRIRYDSASLKMNLALSELPDFSALPGLAAGPQHRGTIHICPDQDSIERAYDDAKYGKPSAEPILECTIPSVVDDSLAPKGRHVMSMFIQYAPYKLAQGTWEEMREPFADRCLDLLGRYAPNIRKAVIGRQVLTPVDMERIYGLTGGNIFHGSMHLNQLFPMRPAPGWASYRMPVKGLYLCGSGSHPGGGVIGAAGWNAAREILGTW
ncbi:MAG: phytoene desaturase family protein [Planctomycetota bacterium]